MGPTASATGEATRCAQTGQRGNASPLPEQSGLLPSIFCTAAELQLRPKTTFQASWSSGHEEHFRIQEEGHEHKMYQGLLCVNGYIFQGHFMVQNLYQPRRLFDSQPLQDFKKTAKSPSSCRRPKSLRPPTRGQAVFISVLRDHPLRRSARLGLRSPTASPRVQAGEGVHL